MQEVVSNNVRYYVEKDKVHAVQNTKLTIDSDKPSMSPIVP